MEFLVKLIVVNDTKNVDARNNLYANCTHVSNRYWLFEGDVEALDEGIDFTVVGEQAIEATGDMRQREIIDMVEDVYNITQQRLKDEL